MFFRCRQKLWSALCNQRGFWIGFEPAQPVSYRSVVETRIDGRESVATRFEKRSLLGVPECPPLVAADLAESEISQRLLGTRDVPRRLRLLHCLHLYTVAQIKYNVVLRDLGNVWTMLTFILDPAAPHTPRVYLHGDLASSVCTCGMTVHVGRASKPQKIFTVKILDILMQTRHLFINNDTALLHSTVFLFVVDAGATDVDMYLLSLRAICS